MKGDEDMKKRKLRKWVKVVLASLSIAFILGVYIDFIRFPECYLSTWRYQLQNEIKAGNAEMIEYYNNNYIKNGRVLFD